jgi:hypothetical protein
MARPLRMKAEPLSTASHTCQDSSSRASDSRAQLWVWLRFCTSPGPGSGTVTSTYGWHIDSSSDAEQKRVQQRLTQRRLEDLHMIRGPGRWIRVGSPSNQMDLSVTSSSFMSPIGVLWWEVFRKMTWEPPVCSCRL